MSIGLGSEIVTMNFCHNWTREGDECQLTAHSSGAWRAQVKQGLRASIPPGVNLRAWRNSEQQPKSNLSVFIDSQ